MFGLFCVPFKFFLDILYDVYNVLNLVFVDVLSYFQVIGQLDIHIRL